MDKIKLIPDVKLRMLNFVIIAIKFRRVLAADFMAEMLVAEFEVTDNEARLFMHEMALAGLIEHLEGWDSDNKESNFGKSFYALTDAGFALLKFFDCRYRQ